MDDVEDNMDYVYDTESTDNDDNNMVEKRIVLADDFDNDDDDDLPNGFSTEKIENVTVDKEERKKQKLEAALSKYEFAPRAVVTPPPVTKPSKCGRNSLTDWTEQESFALLEAWGERYMRHNRRSVRSEEWLEVAQIVSEGSRFNRTETQCRNRLDTLKKKYKKEKAISAENQGFVSQWMYFEKMDMIISSSQAIVTGNGSINSKDYQGNGNGWMNVANSSEGTKDNNDIKVYQNVPSPVTNQVNGNGSMNVANSSEGTKDDYTAGDSGKAKNESEKEDVPVKKSRKGRKRDANDALVLLASSIERYSVAYERIETSKMKQFAELEKMRMDVRRECELEKKKIMKKAQVEIAKICGMDLNDDNGNGNTSG